MRPQVANPKGGVPLTAGTFTRISKKDFGDGPFNITMGEYHIGTSNSLSAAKKRMGLLTELIELLREEKLFVDIANAYFDLVDQRDQLSGILSPVVIERRVEDGHCDGCPAD